MTDDGSERRKPVDSARRAVGPALALPNVWFSANPPSLFPYFRSSSIALPTARHKGQSAVPRSLSINASGTGADGCQGLAAAEATTARCCFCGCIGHGDLTADAPKGTRSQMIPGVAGGACGKVRCVRAAG